MPIQLREDIAYVLMEKISNHELTQPTDKAAGLKIASTDFVGRQATVNDLLAHIDYLNQKGYVQAQFEGDAYANKGPNPVPDAVQLASAALTEKGKELFERMQKNLPDSLQEGPRVPIATEDMDFLKKVMLKGRIEDIYDARDLTEVIFRTMRDLMTTQASDRVASELHEESLDTSEKALQNEVSELWQDTNPLVRFLSRVRPPLEFDSETFMQRVRQEGGLPRSTDVIAVLKAVFSATKEELSEGRIQEVSAAMPGQIKELWEGA